MSVSINENATDMTVDTSAVVSTVVQRHVECPRSNPSISMNIREQPWAPTVDHKCPHGRNTILERPSPARVHYDTYVRK